MATVAGQHETDTVLSARADARAQGGKVADAMPYLPASSTPFPPPGVDPGDADLGGDRRGRKLHAQGRRPRHPGPP